MKLSDFVDDLRIKVELIPLGRINRPSVRYLNPRSVTIHNTDNADRGADANAHSRFVRNTGYYEHNGKTVVVSWHYVVDDHLCIQQLPHNEIALHARSAGNASSLAIEVCMHQEIDQGAANDRAARLAAYLLYEHNLSLNDLKTHKDWTGKNCPSKLLGGWVEFRKQVGGYLTALSAPAVYAFDGNAPFELKGEHWEDIEN